MPEIVPPVLAWAHPHLLLKHTREVGRIPETGLVTNCGDRQATLSEQLAGNADPGLHHVFAECRAAYAVKHATEMARTHPDGIRDVGLGELVSIVGFDKVNCLADLFLNSGIR